MRRIIIISLLCLLASCSSLQERKFLDGIVEYIESFFRKSDLEDKTSKVVRKLPISATLKKWSTENGFVLKQNKLSISIYDRENQYLGKIVKNGKHQVITSFPLMGKKLVNPLLDARLFPNTTYKIENSIFKTDKLARVVSAEISSIPKSIVERHQLRGTRENAKAMAKDGIKGVDHGGHLIAHSLGGNSGALNIVAQSGKLNTGRFASVENLIRKNRKQVKNYKVDVIYKGSSKRPVAFRQQLEFWGSEKQLQRMQKRSKDFKYIMKKDGSGKTFYSCVIYHKNPRKL
ncbi:MAG: hypothetical protein CMO01_21620 [Thalassobius sp.]|nr:hypothetical protein [Thalassovita sp.]